MEADAEWIATLAADNDAHLIAHSFGGGGAPLAAAQQSGAARSLILVEPAPQSLLAGSAVLAVDAAVRADFLRIVRDGLSARAPAQYGLAFARNLGSGRAMEADNAALLALEADPHRADMPGYPLLRARIAAPPTLRATAAAVRRAGMPVMVVAGGWSAILDAVGHFAAELIDGRHVVIRASDHLIPAEAPEACNEVAVALMRKADTR